MRTTSLIILLGALTARAQEAASPPEAPRKLEEIERGLYARALVAPIFLLKTPGTGGGFSPGAAGGVELGFDLDPVPYAYRSRYRDGRDVYYRSDGRAIYGIDARTNAVVEVHRIPR